MMLAPLEESLRHTVYPRHAARGTIGTIRSAPPDPTRPESVTVRPPRCCPSEAVRTCGIRHRADQRPDGRARPSSRSWSAPLSAGGSKARLEWETKTWHGCTRGCRKRMPRGAPQELRDLALSKGSPWKGLSDGAGPARDADAAGRAWGRLSPDWTVQASAGPLTARVQAPRALDLALGCRFLPERGSRAVQVAGVSSRILSRHCGRQASAESMPQRRGSAMLAQHEIGPPKAGAGAVAEQEVLVLVVDDGERPRMLLVRV